jgi:hypothetical protein
LAGEEAVKKLIITTGCDPREQWQEILKISVPRFERYAQRYGYDFKNIWYPDISAVRFPEFWQPTLFIRGAVNYEQRRDFLQWTGGRNLLAPNWLRYAAVQQLLEQYDLIVYFDGDCVIVDFETDLASGIPPEKWLSSAICGPSPDNAGPGGPLWITRSCPESKAFWLKVWQGRKWVTHPLWTDGVDFMDLLGYSIMPPVHKERETEYDSAFHRLSDKWAVWDDNPSAEGKCYHIAGGTSPMEKAGAMRDLIARLGI